MSIKTYFEPIFAAKSMFLHTMSGEKMFWIGRLNAILAIVGFVGLGVMWYGGAIQAAIGWVIVMFLVRIALGVMNTLWTAISGTPLFYDVKVIDKDETDG